MKSQQQINADISDALGSVRAYRGSEPYQAFIRLLDAVDADHGAHLLTAKLDDVQKIQGAASQVRALRHALVNNAPHASPVG